MTSLASTIAAISTPPGKGGVAIIRISGPDAKEIAERIFSPISAAPIFFEPRKQRYGYIIRGEEAIDDGMLTFFPAPNSYTGEDVVEISCHGGFLVTGMVLEAALSAGAHPAERGEFTKRAFINGKLSLSEAEAVGMLLDAESGGQLKLAGHKSRERLNVKTEELRKAILNLMSSIYAKIDYPDEELAELSDSDVLNALKSIGLELERLISTYRTGRAVKDGISTVICGKPNVGKSTLYNLLLGEDDAIVTDIPGTTRDILEHKIPLADIMLRLYDTAGIRNSTCDEVEKIGIERSLERIKDCELILALFDSSRKPDGEDEAVIRALEDSTAEKIAIITKCDLPTADRFKEFEAKIEKSFTTVLKISVSADADSAIELLRSSIVALFTDEKLSIGTDAIVSSARQLASLNRALECINSAIGAYELGMPQDAASSDIELALGAISELDGRAVSEEVVADIFSRFCVGK